MALRKTPRQYKSPGDEYSYAGTTDLVCKLDGKVTVVDFKTGTKPKDKNGYPEWPLQTAAYRHALVSTYQPVASGVLHLDKEKGMPTYFDYTSTYDTDLEAFLFLLKFWQNRNSDKLKDGHIVSVTEALSILDKSGPLMWWAVNCMRDRFYELMKDFTGARSGISFTDAQVVGWIEDARKNFRKVSQKAMNIGSAVHTAIENYLRTGIEPKIENDQILAGFIAFLEFQDQHNLKPLDLEVTIYG